jgi:enoyl-CoA hydratase/carnithine racemase
MAVRFERDGDLAVIVLASPPLNLLGGDLGGELDDAITQASAPDVRAVLLRAEGPNFSAGAQVQRFQSSGGDENGAAARGGPGLFLRLETLTVPTVAAIQGNCLAGGLELALSCDVIWAADDAKIGLVETTIGGFPFAGGVQRLVQRMGATRAKQAIFDGARYSAAQMLDWGLVSKVVPAAELEAQAHAYALKLAAGPTLAFRAIKQLATVAVDEGLDAADALTPGLAAKIQATEDMQSGVKSLLANGPGHGVFAGR